MVFAEQVQQPNQDGQSGLPTQWVSRLIQGASDLGIELSEQQTQQICHYVLALKKWNQAYNLTAISDLEGILGLHLLDSLSVVQPLLPYLRQRIIDVGTGAGLPGILLAIIWPQQQVHLLDTNGKKTRFLLQCKHQLALNNVTVVNQRVETYQPASYYDVVISRAFAAIDDMLLVSQHLATCQGVFAAMKGQLPEQEIANMPANFMIKEQVILSVPHVDADRHLFFIQKRAL